MKMVAPPKVLAIVKRFVGDMSGVKVELVAVCTVVPPWINSHTI